MSSRTGNPWELGAGLGDFDGYGIDFEMSLRSLLVSYFNVDIEIHQLMKTHRCFVVLNAMEPVRK